jgi:DNA-directed RNA polymerase subunit RPC12/RpoP
MEQIKETFTCQDCGEELDIKYQSKRAKIRCQECQNKKIREYRASKKIDQGKPKIVDIPDIPDSDNKTTKKVKKIAPKSKSTKEIKEVTSGVIQTIFGLVATRAGEHWEISEDEANNITDPMINLLDKYGLFKKIQSNMDMLMLLGAIGTVITPRAITSYQISKLKGGAKNAELRGEKKEATNSSRRDSKPEHGQNSQVDENINNKDVITPFTF